MRSSITPTGNSLPSIPTRRQALCSILAASAGCFGAPVSSAGFEVRVITNGDGEATKQILQSFSKHLPGYHAFTDIREVASRRGSAVHIAVGPAALQSALDANLSGPLLSVFTSSETYARLTAGSQSHRKPDLTTAIFAEASPMHQMALVRELYGRAVSVGVLLTASSASIEPLLRSSAQAMRLQLDVQTLESGANPIQGFARLRSSTVILAVPDRDLYTATNFRDILESTYRRSQPVIGFSIGMVHAGALAAAYSTVDDTVAHVRTAVADLAAGRLLEPQYPLYWRASVNYSVAKSMNVVVSDSVRALGNFPA